VLKGIAQYGVTKPQLLIAPFLVVWNLTNACNLKCKHCYQRAGTPAPDELTLEEKRKVVNELADAGVVSIAFSGGEPLMHPDFFPIVAEARKRGMFVAVATNGTMIDEKMAQRLKDGGVGYVEISLDSTRPELHDDFRGVPGSWKRTIEGIKNCVKVGLYTVMATTVTRLNVAEVPNLIRMAKRLGVKRFTHFNFIPAGRAREILDLDLSPMEREELLKLLYQESKTIGIECLSTSPQYARVVLQNSKGEAVAPTHFCIGEGNGRGLQTLADFIGGCGCGRLYCAIQPNGDVTPCVFMPQCVIGDLRKSSFSEIWQESELLGKLRSRELLEGSCGSCGYKLVCGGCRARSLGYFEDFAAPDPGCIYNQRAWAHLHSSITNK
jgi:radical SAM protein with 4Fe4S-binding SPASM domain